MRLVAATLARADGLDAEEARRRTARGWHQAEGASLAEHAGDDARVVHMLVARAVRFQDAEASTREQLRSAVIDALAAVLPGLADIRAHHDLALDLLHARELCSQAVDDRALLRLGGWVAYYDHLRAAYAGARALGEEVLAGQRRVLGAEHPTRSPP